MPSRVRARPFSNSIFVALLAYIALITTIDRLTPQAFRLDVYAAVAPLVAAALCSYRQAIVVAAIDFAAMAGLVAAAPDDPRALNKVSAVLGNLMLTGVSVIVARLLRDRDALLERLRVTGEASQRALLRGLPLRSREVTVDGFYVSSQEDALVGGDIYEVLETPWGTRVLIGDVQGKGLRTLGAGAAVLTAFREAAYYRRDLQDGVAAMEHGLRRYASSAAAEDGLAAEGDGGPAEERFVTATVFAVDDRAPPPGGRSVPLAFVDCGHLAPYLIEADGTVTELDPAERGLPLGLGELAERPRTVQRVTLPADARLFTCTDGVTEARAPDGSFYPLADRLSGWSALPTPELLARLRADLDAHTGGRLQDDAAALIMERTRPDADRTGAQDSERDTARAGEGGATRAGATRARGGTTGPGAGVAGRTVSG